MDTERGGQKLLWTRGTHYDGKGTLTAGDKNYCGQEALTMMEKGHSL